jgi:hypothetical protein
VRKEIEGAFLPELLIYESAGFHDAGRTLAFPAL